MPKRATTPPKKKYSPEVEQIFDRAKMISQQTPGIVNKIVEQMEYTRSSYGLSIREFSFIIGMRDANYNKARERGSIRLQFFLNFCLVFGFDISMLLDNARYSAKGSPTMDFAVSVGHLNEETLNQFLSILKESDDDEDNKKRAVIALNSIAKEKPVGY